MNECNNKGNNKVIFQCTTLFRKFYSLAQMTRRVQFSYNKSTGDIQENNNNHADFETGM